MRKRCSEPLPAGTPIHSQAYTYDRYGNILTIRIDNGTPVSIAVDGATNRLGSSLATYDTAGQMLTRPGLDTKFQYDGSGMVTESTVAGTTKVHLYTASDERIASIAINAVTRADLGSDWSIRDASGKVLSRLSRAAGSGNWSGRLHSHLASERGAKRTSRRQGGGKVSRM